MVSLENLLIFLFLQYHSENKYVCAKNDERLLKNCTQIKIIAESQLNEVYLFKTLTLQEINKHSENKYKS